MVTHFVICEHCGSKAILPRKRPTRRFCTRFCKYESERADRNKQFAYGRSLGTDGYIHLSDTKREHIAIAEKALGHHLPVGAQVHHVDGNRTNNAPSNLVICENRLYHTLLHWRARIVRAGGNPDIERLCGNCNTVLHNSKFGTNRRRRDGLALYCRECTFSRRRKAYLLNESTSSLLSSRL